MKSMEMVIAKLRRMSEIDLHKRVVVPLLKNMSFRYVRYVHGSFERGKDLLYLSEDAYGDWRVEVCQVKNSPFTGRATSSASTSTTLTQLQQCRHTSVLNPLTHKMEVPKAVVLLTTHAIPDRDVAGTDDFLIALDRLECKIVGPERLVTLIEQYLPDYYSETVFPGESMLEAMKQYVNVHHEARAFRIRNPRPIDQWCVNLGASDAGSTLDRLSKKRLPVSWHTNNPSPIPTNRIEGLLVRQENLGMPLRRIPIFTPPYSRADLKKEENKTEVPIDHVDLSDFLEKLETQLAQAQMVPDGMGEGKRQRARATKAIIALHQSAELVNDLFNGLEDLIPSDVFKDSNQRQYTLNIPEVDPRLLLGIRDNAAIVGDAGAGKTTFARMITRAAIENGIKCIYFPCAVVQTREMSLKDSMLGFLRSIGGGVSKKSAAHFLSHAELIIIDGCDEAATFGEQLSEEIKGFAFARPLYTDVKGVQRSTPEIPPDLDHLVSYDMRRKRFILERFPDRLAIYRLRKANHGTPFAKAIDELEKKAHNQNPRLIITTRGHEVLDLGPEWITLRLMPFSIGQLEEFFRSWFLGTDKDAGEVLTVLNRNPHLRDACRTPIVATQVAALHENGRRLPQSKTGIYEDRFELLFWDWDEARTVANRNRVEERDKWVLLSRLALQMHRERRRRFTANELGELWDEGFRSVYPDLSVSDLLWELQVYNSVVIQEIGGGYSLGHLSYQEFLAAKGVVFGQYWRELVDCVHDPWWKNTLIFYAGLCGDVSHLFDLVQLKHGLEQTRGVVADMLQEARYTSAVVKDAVGDFLAEDEDAEDFEMRDGGEYEVFDDDD